MMTMSCQPISPQKGLGVNITVYTKCTGYGGQPLNWGSVPRETIRVPERHCSRQHELGLAG